MTRFNRNVIGFFLLLAVVGGLYAYWLESGDRDSPAVTSSLPEITSLTLLEEPRALPRLQFVDGDGATLTLADFGGRVVLLNIWATWCVPCRKEMPTLERLQEKLGGSQFEVVALSIDAGGVSAVQTFYNENGIHHLAVYMDPSGKIARDLEIIGVPTTLLIDRDGRELARLIGPAVWDSPEIVGVINGIIAAPPTAQSGHEWFPQRLNANSEPVPSSRLFHGDVKPLVGGNGLTFQ